MDDAASTLEDDDGIALGLRSRTRSSWMFLAVNSPMCRVMSALYAGIVVLTRFTLGNDDVASLQDVFEPLEVDVPLCGPGSSASGHNCLLDGELNNQSLYAWLVNLVFYVRNIRYLCVRKQVIVHKICNSQFTDARVSKGDADSLCLDISRAGRGWRVRYFDSYDNRGGRNVNIAKEHFFDILQVPRRCLSSAVLLTVEQTNTKRTHLFVQLKLRRSLALPYLWHIYLHLQLSCGESIPQECFGRVGTQRNTRKTASAARTEVFEDGVGVVDVCSNVQSVRSMCGVVVSTVE